VKGKGERRGSRASVRARLLSIALPFVAALPSRIAYGAALVYGDVWYRLSSLRGETIECVELLFGDRLSPEQCEQVARSHYRIRSCELVDRTLFQSDEERLLSLVEVKGLENLNSALAGGRGAVVCSGHFTAIEITTFSLIGALRFPITIVARWSTKSSYRDFHFARPNIERRPGNYSMAVQVMDVLRQNELVGIMVDHAFRQEDASRRSAFEFLNKRAYFVPGATTIAQLAGSPVIVATLHRAPDWRHQVLEVSPPISVGRDPVETFGECLKIIETSVRQNPAQWKKLTRPDLRAMGLASKEGPEAEH